MEFSKFAAGNFKSYTIGAIERHNLQLKGLNEKGNRYG